jgi:hypothetical protein
LIRTAKKSSRDTKAFQIASTPRQFTQVWDLENRDERGRGLVDLLRARLLHLQGGELRLAPADLQPVRGQATPYEGRLEAILDSCNGMNTRESPASRRLPFPRARCRPKGCSTSLSGRWRLREKAGKCRSAGWDRARWCGGTNFPPDWCRLGDRPRCCSPAEMLRL